MSKAQAVLSIWAVFTASVLARSIGYQLPIAGGPVFKDDQQLFEFVVGHEILKFVDPEVEIQRAVPKNEVLRSPAEIKKLSRTEAVSHQHLGQLQIVYLPTWCGHKHSTDHIAYVLRRVPAGLQLVGRTEYESGCEISATQPYWLTCDSYHGAKGWSFQEWKGKTFQSRDP